MQVEKVGEYFSAHIKSSSKVFILAFSGVNTSPGRFNYIRSFSDLDVNVIYLNTCGNDYYHFGIKGVADDLQGTCDYIKTFISKYCSDPVIYTFGCSMGGYGAALYGSLLDVKAILAIGPTVPLYSEFFNAHESRQEHYEQFNKLKTLLIESEVEKVFLYGDRTLNDILSYQFFAKSAKTKCEIYLGTPHALIMLLVQIMPLSELFGIMTSNNLAQIPFKSTNYYKNSDWLFSYSDNDQADGIRGPESFLTDINIICLNDLEYTELYVLGVSCLKTGLRVKAFQCFKLSLSKSFTPRALSRLLDLKLQNSDLLEVLLITNKRICSGDLLKLEKSELTQGYSLYCRLVETLEAENVYNRTSNVRGFVDGVFGSVIKGWCFVENNEGQGVELRINDSLIAEHKSDQYRKDLEDNGIGNGEYAFSFDVDFKLISGLMKDQKYTLALLVDKYTSEVIPRGRMIIKAPFTSFHIENYEKDNFSGWVVDHSYPSRKMVLDVVINGECVQKITPSIARRDLEANGFDLLSGFSFSLKGLKSGLNELLFKDSKTGFYVSNAICVTV